MKKPAPSHPIDATVQRRLDALERLIDSEYDGKASVFEAHTAIKMAQVNQWFSGYRALRDKALRRLETVTKKPEGWFDGNTANAAITAPSPTVSATGGPGIRMEHSNVAAAALGTRRIPLIDYVQAGLWTAIADAFQPGDAYDWLLTDLELSPGAFALQIKGDSMIPEFNPGDRVIIDPDVMPQAGDYVVAKNGGEEATFKKYRLRGHDDHGNDVFELIPLNEDYATLRSDLQPIKIVGTMVEHRRYRKKR